MKGLLVSALAAVLLLALPAAASAANACTRVAAPNGSDAAAGTEDAPLRSPQALLESLEPGETGCLRGGTYESTYDNILYPRHGGREGEPITLRSYPGERARLVGIIDIPHGADYLTLTGLHIEGTGADGANTLKVYSRGVVVEDSEITNLRRGRSCLMLGNTLGGGEAVAPVIRRNTFHDCGSPAQGNHDHAIYAANVSDGEIVDNLFYNSAAYTIQLYPNARGTRFAHNVVDGGGVSVRGGIVFGGDSRYASSDNVVEQNVIAGAATSGITSYWEGPVGTGNVARDNCVWGSRDGDITPPRGFAAFDNATAKPRFLNPARRDYRLARTSPCLRRVGYDTLARFRGGGAAPRHSVGSLPRLRLSVRPAHPAHRASASSARPRLRRVRLEVSVRGATRGTVRVVLQRRRTSGRGWARPRARVMRVHGDRVFVVEARVRAGSYRAWAWMRDTAGGRTARSAPLRLRVR